jgi:hypothetical protein
LLFGYKTIGEDEFSACWCSGNVAGRITCYVIGSRAGRLLIYNAKGYCLLGVMLEGRLIPGYLFPDSSAICRQFHGLPIASFRLRVEGCGARHLRVFREEGLYSGVLGLGIYFYASETGLSNRGVIGELTVLLSFKEAKASKVANGI